jgi:hypothetical protein
MLETQSHVPRDGHRTVRLVDGARRAAGESARDPPQEGGERRTLIVSLRTSSSSPLSAAGAAAGVVVVVVVAASAVSSATLLTAPTCLTLVAVVEGTAAFLGGRGGSLVAGGAAAAAAAVEAARADHASRVCLADRRAGWRSIRGRGRSPGPSAKLRSIGVTIVTRLFPADDEKVSERRSALNASRPSRRSPPSRTSPLSLCLELARHPDASVGRHILRPCRQAQSLALWRAHSAPTRARAPPPLSTGFLALLLLVRQPVLRSSTHTRRALARARTSKRDTTALTPLNPLVSGGPLVAPRTESLVRGD